MANYRYKINITYSHKTGNNKYDNYEFEDMNVLGCIIHSDYVNNNLPIVILDISIESAIANIMVNTANIQNDKIILDISKVDIDDDMEIELPYINGEFTYYTFDQVNKNANLDYDTDITPTDPSTLTRHIKLGLMSSEGLKSNAMSLNGVVTNTDMQSLVQHCLNNTDMSTLIEQFDYNKQITQLMLPPLTSLSQIIKHLNGISVFYSTPYRFFIDFDVIYLISSSGEMVPKKGDTINSIMFDVGDVADMNSKIEGMFIVKQQGLYYIPVTFNDCHLADNYITSQQYSTITALTGSDMVESSLDLRSGDNAVNLTKSIRIANDNIHMVENIAASIANSNTRVSLYKVGVDNSIFTPNREYSIKYNNSYDESHSGKYLLNSKQEVFIKDGNNFIGAVMLSLAKIGS